MWSFFRWPSTRSPGSWGYQVSAYFAPTARYGTPDDLRFLIDALHTAGIGVILDWVPAHFPEGRLRAAPFDGTALYEHEDPRRGEHPEWGTLIFNYGRREVRNFLVANALYWLEEFHVDGLRVDAVASMLYLDYSRERGRSGCPTGTAGARTSRRWSSCGSSTTRSPQEHPGCFTIAEESTAVAGCDRADGAGRARLHLQVEHGVDARHPGLLRARAGAPPLPPRRLTFAMMYEYSEHFIMPLSHDEVVHGKGSLLDKMPGDLWQSFANLRAAARLPVHAARANSCCSWAPSWRRGASGTTTRASTGIWPTSRSTPAWCASWPTSAGSTASGPSSGGRIRTPPASSGSTPTTGPTRSTPTPPRRRRSVVVLLNLTPVPRPGYQAGAPAEGRWSLLPSSDAPQYGGSGYGLVEDVRTELDAVAASAGVVPYRSSAAWRGRSGPRTRLTPKRHVSARPRRRPAR